jgi:hypothetical protein
MTILTIHLNWTGGACEIGTQVRAMVQLDLPRIACARSQRREFRMFTVEILYRAYKLESSAAAS